MLTDTTTEILKEILVWTRVGFYSAAKDMLEDVLNSNKKRIAFQAAEGSRSIESIRVEAQMSPNDVSELFNQCINLGLMATTDDGKRKRLFDLGNFGLLPQIETVKKKGAGN